MSIGRGERLVGRQSELAALQQWLARAGAGDGGCYVVSGEPGVGKSRLVAEAVGALPATWLVTRGRAADRDRPAPFRAIAEALLAASRRRSLPGDPGTRAFAAVLGQLVPAWRQGAAAGEPLVVMAEAVLRVLAALAAPGPAVMVVEDVQWADPETLAMLDYLADNVAGQPAALVLTVRSDTPSPGLALTRELTARRAASAAELARLGAADAAELAAECLGVRAVDPDISAFLSRAGGLPFLVEELAAAAVREGLLAEADGRWLLTGTPGPLVPDSYRELTGRRLATLGGAAAQVTRVAAVAGLPAEVRLLSLAAGLSAAETGAAVQEAITAGLLSADNPASADGPSPAAGTGQRVGFRHALVRDAVLACLVPGQRAALAAQALDALTGGGALAGDGEAALDALELAVDLAEQAGELARSAHLLLTLARRAMAGGGLASAEACLRRGMHRTAGDAALTASLGEAMVELLVHQGDLRELAAIEPDLLATLARLGSGPARSADVHLRIAGAAAAAGDPAWAAAEAQRAHALALAAGDVPLRLAADTATAHAALAAGETGRAAALARQVIASGLAAPDTVLDAWMIVGRAQRQHDLAAASAAFESAHAIAVSSGSPLTELSALHELATVAMLDRADAGPLTTARDRAEQLGAIGLTAQLSLQLSGTYALTGRATEALADATRARDLARRLRQPTVEAMALMQIATAHAVREAEADMEAAAGAALALGGGDPNVTVGVWGHARALCALLREDRALARDALTRAAAAADRAAGIHGVFWAVWGLVSLLTADEPAGGVTARLSEPDVQALPVNQALAGYPRAVAAGLRGDSGGAARLVLAAEQALAGQGAFDLWRQLCRRLTAEAALAAGWGEPVAWLRECLAFFGQSGHGRAATACRVLLSQAGAPVPRRTGDAGAPPELAALGVTAREADVLGLVADGLTNREISQRLFLSPRTVEKHVERLLAKTGTPNRSQLVAWAARREP